MPVYDSGLLCPERLALQPKQDHACKLRSGRDAGPRLTCVGTEPVFDLGCTFTALY